MKINLITTLLLLLTVLPGKARGVEYTVSETTGAVESITIEGDTTAMNWVLKPDGSQYRWITAADGWGLG